MTFVWNTEVVVGRERFSFWQDAVCQAVLSVATERPLDHNFDARITSQDCGSAKFAAFEASGHGIVRRRAHIASLIDGGYLVSMQLQGVGHIEQSDNRFVLRPGEIAVLDGERPFRVNFPDAVKRLVAVIPRTLLESRAPWIRRSSTRKISGNSAIVELARQHFLQLTCAESKMGLRDYTLLAENFCNLLAIATTPDRDAVASCQITTETLLSLIEQNLCNPELSPTVLAQMCGISVRTLHNRFRSLGMSYSEWILHNRLQACKAALEDPQQRHLSISELAFQHGFNDLSHFNKSFRRKYEITPRECRNEQSATTPTIRKPFAGEEIAPGKG